VSKRPKRDHSTVWARLQEHFGPPFLAAGFRPLPEFGSGYDPSNRMWECWFIAAPASDGIRLVDLAYAPHDRCWFLTGQLNACTDAAERIARLSPSQWFADILVLPCRQTDLNVSAGGAFWRRPRVVSFDQRTGAPVTLEWSLRRATLALPAFLRALARPGDPLRDGDFRVLASTGSPKVTVIDA